MKSMNRAIEKFLYKHPRLGIRGLIKYIVIAQIVVYLLLKFTGILSIVDLIFVPDLIIRGQVWRIVTWLVIPPDSWPFILDALYFYFVFFLGSALENTWGKTKFTFYYLCGIILTILYSILARFFGDSESTILSSFFITTEYFHLSLFFAFATLFPDVIFRVFFIIPIKVKWLALFDAAFFIYGFIRSIISLEWFGAFITLVPLLNYVILIGIPALMSRPRIRYARPSPKVSRNDMREAIYNHKCVICGRTDITDPQLEFRYCSQCAGFQCYCEDHIDNHTHI